MTECEVSVIIPAWNRAGMLGDAVASVLEQSMDSFELIVVDDASTDSTVEMLSGPEGRIRVVRQPRRRGVSACRNLGASLARGSWLAFLDSDDLWLPEKLELQMDALRNEPGMRAAHTDEVWVRDGVRVNQMKKHAKRGGNIFEHCLPMCRISPSSVVIERGLFESLGGFDEHFRVCEDYELWLRLTAREPVLYLDRRLIVKRGGHQDQLSSSHWGFDRYRVRAIEGILAGGVLDSAQRLAALRELRRKARILHKGYAKRGKKLLARRYRRIAERAETGLREIAAGPAS